MCVYALMITTKHRRTTMRCLFLPLVVVAAAAVGTTTASWNCVFPYSSAGGDWGASGTWFTPEPPTSATPVVVDARATIGVTSHVSAGGLTMNSGTHIVVTGALVVDGGGGGATPTTSCVRSRPLTGPVAVSGNGTHISVTPPTVADSGGAPVLAYHVLMRTGDGVPLGVGEADVTLVPTNGQLGLVHVLDVTKLLRVATGYTAGVVVETRHGVSDARTWSGPWTTESGLPDWALLAFDTPWARAAFYDSGGSVWTPPLASPSALTTDAAQLVASWPPVNPGSVAGASAYDVEAVPRRDTGCGAGNVTAAARVPPNSLLSLLDVDPGGAYAVRVRGENAAHGPGEWSPFVNATVPSSPPTGVSGLLVTAIDDRGIHVATPVDTTRVGCSGSGMRQPLSAFHLWARLGDDVWRLPGPCPSLLDPGSTHDVFASATTTHSGGDKPPRDTTPGVVTWERVDTASTLPLRTTLRAPHALNTSLVADRATGEFGLTIHVVPSPRDVLGRVVAWTATDGAGAEATAPAVAIGATDIRVTSGVLEHSEYTFSVFGQDADGVDGDPATVVWLSPGAIPPGPARDLVSVATSSVVSLHWLPPVHTGGSASLPYTVTFIDTGTGLPVPPDTVVVDPVVCTALHDCSTTAVFTSPPVSQTLTTVVSTGTTAVNTTTVLLPAGAPDAPLVSQRNATGGSVTLDVVAPIETGGAPVTHVCVVGGDCGVYTSSPHTVRVRAPVQEGCRLSCAFSVLVTLRNSLGQTSSPVGIDVLTSDTHTPIVLPEPRFHGATGGSVLVSLDWGTTDAGADTGGYALEDGVYATDFSPGRGTTSQEGRYNPACKCVTMRLVGIPVGTDLAWVAPAILSPHATQTNVTSPPPGAATLDRATEPGLPASTGVSVVAPTSTANAWSLAVGVSSTGVDVGGLPPDDTYFTASVVLTAIPDVTTAQTAAQLPSTTTLRVSYATPLVQFAALPWSDVNATVTFSTASQTLAVESARLGPPSPPGQPLASFNGTSAVATRHAIVVPDGSWVPPPPADSGGSAVVAYRLVVDNFFAGGGSLNVEDDTSGTGFRAQLPSTGARTLTLRVRSVTRDATVSTTAMSIPVTVPAPCPAGTYDPVYTNISAVFTDLPCVPCPAGTWTDSTGDVSACPPCPAGTRALSGVGCVSCPPGTFSDAAALACTPCPAGTYTPVPGHGACLPCPGAEAGIEYALQGAVGCSPCPAALSCPSGHLWVPQGVWWDTADGRAASSRLNGTFYPCPDFGRCSASGARTVSSGDFVPILNASDVAALTPGCTNDRWTGVLCKECPPHYVSATGTCIACTPQWASAILVLVMVAVAAGVTAFLIRRALVNEDPKVSSSSPVVVLRICISHVQRLGALALLKIQGPGEFRLMSGAADVLAGISPDLIPVRCLFGLGFYDTFWVFMAAPVVSVSIAVTVVLLAGVCKRRKKKKKAGTSATWPGHAGSAEREAGTGTTTDDATGRQSPQQQQQQADTRRRQRRPQRQQQQRRGLKRSKSRVSDELRADANVAITSAVVIMFLMYVTLAKACFRMFDCYDVEIDGDVRLNAEFSVVCGTARHRRASVAALVFGSVYLVMAPGATFVWLWRNAERLSSPAFRRYWRFVYDVYKLRAPGRGGTSSRSGRYMWEGAILTEKLFLIGASAFIQNARVQAISVFSVLALALASHTGARPYRLPVANTLATGSYLVVMATQLTALYAWASDGTNANTNTRTSAVGADGGSPEPGKSYSAMLGVMLGINTAFFLYAAVVFIARTRQARRAKQATGRRLPRMPSDIVTWDASTSSLPVTPSSTTGPRLEMTTNPLKRRHVQRAPP